MDQKEKTDIRSLNLKELTVFMEQLGEKAFRAKQIYPYIIKILRTVSMRIIIVQAGCHCCKALHIIFIIQRIEYEIII